MRGTAAMNCNTEFTKHTFRSKPKPELFNLKLGMIEKSEKECNCEHILSNKAIRSQHSIIYSLEAKLTTNNNKTKK